MLWIPELRKAWSPPIQKCTGQWLAAGVVCSFCHVLLVTSWAVTHQAPCPWNSPGLSTGVGCPSLLQGVFPAQGSNLRVSCGLHLQVDSSSLGHLGRPRASERGAWKTAEPRCVRCTSDDQRKRWLKWRPSEENISSVWEACDSFTEDVDFKPHQGCQQILSAYCVLTVLIPYPFSAFYELCRDCLISLFKV